VASWPKTVNTAEIQALPCVVPEEPKIERSGFFFEFSRRTEEKSGDRGSRAPSLNARESLRQAKVQASLVNMGFANIWATKAECNGKGQRRW